MDLVNNLIFTALNSVPAAAPNFGPLTQNYFFLPAVLNGPPNPVNRGNFYSYDTNIIEEFCAVDDTEFIENAIQKHWADMVTGRDYIFNGVAITRFTNPNQPNPALANHLIPLYHLMYAYLVENTRIAQVFERLLYLYFHDEKLRKITPANNENRRAFQWLTNTESLFFKKLSSGSYRNIISHIRPAIDSTRRNAYFRLLGMDLAFGDAASNAPVAFQKAEFNNQAFIVLFERLLTEIWQAYTNARNQVGPNSTDMFTITDTAQKIQELLMSRRTTETTFDNYRYFNLSKEEFASVVLMSWLYEVISYDSPIVQFLRCNGNTPGERLINIGLKVGLPAHSKSEGLLDIAPPMNTLLRRIELGNYNNEGTVTNIIRAQALNLPVNNPNRMALNDLLLIINNWEKATGHRIKNPEARITGNVKLQSNGVKAQPALN